MPDQDTIVHILANHTLNLLFQGLTLKGIAARRGLSSGDTLGGTQLGENAVDFDRNGQEVSIAILPDTTISVHNADADREEISVYSDLDHLLTLADQITS